MAAANTVYVITGANRGIGLGLFQAYLSQPGSTVVGIVRSDASAAALEQAAKGVSKGLDSTYHVVLLDFTKDVSPETSLELFRSATNNDVAQVDTLICSAGHAGAMSPILTTKPSDLRESFEVNTIGPLAALQALWPLLEKAATPKFVVLSSSLGSIGDMEPLPSGGYGPSKAAVNHVVKSVHQQLESVVSISLHPGFVQTNMGRAAAEQWGLRKGPPHTLEESVRGIVEVVQDASREAVSGKFVDQTGRVMKW